MELLNRSHHFNSYASFYSCTMFLLVCSKLFPFSVNAQTLRLKTGQKLSVVFPTQTCMMHIFCLIYWYCDNFFFHCKLKNIFKKQLMHLWNMDFTSKNTNKLDMLWRIPSLWYICGRMLYLIAFSFFKLIETYNNPVCYLTSANLPSLK